MQGLILYPHDYYTVLPNWRKSFLSKRAVQWQNLKLRSTDLKDDMLFAINYLLSTTFHPLIVVFFNVDSISWDEMAKYDLPAMVNFILKKTEQPSLHYAGHSQGSLIAFAELSRNQDLAQKIKAVFALGPVAYLGHMESPLKFLADFLPELEVIQSWKNGDLKINGHYKYLVGCLG